MHLFFVGMKHCGKSTFAPLIAEDAGMTCADSDDLLLMMPDITSVRSFYRTHGQEAFMMRELEAVEKYLEEHPDGVLSLGGGAADNIPLMNLLKKKGKIVTHTYLLNFIKNKDEMGYRNAIEQHFYVYKKLIYDRAVLGEQNKGQSQ